MEELAKLRQLLVAGNTREAIALVDELEEMSKKAIIRNIESYLVLLLAHLIKYQAEQRITNFWLASIVNAVVGIKKLNLRDKNSYYIKKEDDWNDYLEEAIELASLEAAKEAFGGIYSVEQLSTKFDRDRVIKMGFQLLQLTYQEETKKLPQIIQEFLSDRPT
ncbi:protein of unknown function DUF29 [Stanieria cyanosphaera PCC 7437]|uniref:DUF29 family protein n=1 Tax=Stanieria cyanosphaera (strain ATCC 29371 / PCC 7437) TaxID=111780 RepID=K9XQ08_STAC7|nr:DUF29 family protein [Stanieria cyanosphaera]AFZ34126.1 protein of unknown function DUF29 [Stanieria cyanosphaera PCC 7437]